MTELNETKTTDEVIQETRRIKETLARNLGFDLDRILADTRDRQKKSKRKILSPPVHQEAVA